MHEIFATWTLSKQQSIQGNTIVDSVAKGALANDVDHCRLPYTDFRQAIINYIFKMLCVIFGIPLNRKSFMS